MGFDPEHCTKAALEILLKPGMTFYDLGAKIGIFSTLASGLVGPDGCVVAVEPFPFNFRALEKNTRELANIQRVPVAISDQAGMAEFTTSSNTSEGSLIETYIPVDQRREIIPVVTARIDSLMTLHRWPEVVKMDLESGEVLALLGATMMLEKARPIMLIELHNTAEAVAKVLGHYNYEGGIFGYEGSIKKIISVEGDSPHAVCIPAEHKDSKELTARFSSRDFPTCQRCKAYRRDYES